MLQTIQNILQRLVIKHHNNRSKVFNQRKEKENIIDIIINDILVDYIIDFYVFLLN